MRWIPIILFSLCLIVPAHGAVLVQSGWENTQAGSCSSTENDSCDDYWRCIDATSDTTCAAAPFTDDEYYEGSIPMTQSVTSSSAAVHSGSNAYLKQLGGGAEQATDGHVAVTFNTAGLTEWYASVWVKFLTQAESGTVDWAFNGYHRNKGFKMEAGGSDPTNPYGGWTTHQEPVGKGYGPVGDTDGDKLTYVQGLGLGADKGDLVIANYGAYNQSSTGTCQTSDDGCGEDCYYSNHPRSCSVDIYGPAEGNNYWPNCDATFRYFQRGIWYQVIWHHKISEDDGEIDVWVRETDAGTLKKVIELNRNSWTGTVYDVSETGYCTDCSDAAATVVLQLFPYFNSPVTATMQMAIDDFIVATTFSEVEEYGLNGSAPTVPSSASGGHHWQ